MLMVGMVAEVVTPVHDVENDGLQYWQTSRNDACGDFDFKPGDDGGERVCRVEGVEVEECLYMVCRGE